jgi:hypothetical protein
VFSGECKRLNITILGAQSVDGALPEAAFRQPLEIIKLSQAVSAAPCLCAASARS